MGQLFSQAVDEQLAEQHQVHQIIGEVRAALARIEDVTGAQLRDTVRSSVQATTGPAVDGAVARGLGPGLAELRLALDALDRRIDELMRRMTVVSDAISGMPDGIDLDALQLGVASLRGAVEARAAASPSREDLVGAVAQGTEAVINELQQQRQLVVGAVTTQVNEALAGLGEGLTRSDLHESASQVTRTLAIALREQQEQLSGALSGLHAAVMSIANAPKQPTGISAAEVGSVVGEVVGEVLTELLDDVLPRSLAGAFAARPQPVTASDLLLAKADIVASISMSQAVLTTEEISVAVQAALQQGLQPRLGELNERLVALATQAAVESSVAASEQRMRAYIDEAVLALAEVVLTPPAAERAIASLED